MNGANLLLDTNILIYYFQGEIAAKRIVEGNTIFISIITEMELLSHSQHTISERALISKFLAHLTIRGISQEIKNEAIQIRRSKKLKLPDSIILATSVVEKLPLITADQQLAKTDGYNIIQFQ